MKIRIVHDAPAADNLLAVALRRNGVRATLQGIRPGAAEDFDLAPGEAISVSIGAVIEPFVPVVEPDPEAAEETPAEPQPPTATEQVERAQPPKVVKKRKAKRKAAKKRAAVQAAEATA